MQIEPGNYSIESFLEYLVANRDKVFRAKGERKWLKTHLLYVQNGWQNIFKKYSLESWGEIWHFSIPENATSVVDFYAYQWNENLLACFTASTQETYENTLLRVVSVTRGISEAWIKPDVFEQLKNYMLDKYHASIYHFISTRSRSSNTLPKVQRPDFNRRLNYSGEDAGEVLKETQTLYGTLPKTIDFNVLEDKVQLNRNGLIVMRDVNLRTTGIIREVTDRVLSEQNELLKTSEKLQTSITPIGEGEHIIQVPTLIAGKISFIGSKFDTLQAEILLGHHEEEKETEEYEGEQLEGFNFSFIDTYITDTMYSATAVDEQKGTVFGLSGDSGQIVLVPKHRTTFESFVRFYVEILESFDRSAVLTTFGEQVGR